MEGQELRQLQLSELGILQIFKELCDKHGLRYYLHAGTLLGAVRHRGFIPWDDDIDVCMPREDYDKLISLPLPEGYYYQDSFSEPEFPFFFAKIRKEGTEVFEPYLEKTRMRKGQYIDVFPLDVCPDGKWTSYLYFKIVGLFNSVYMGKVNPEFSCGYTKPYMKLLYRWLSRLPVETIRRRRQRFGLLPSRLCSGKRVCSVGGVHGYPAETFLTAWYHDPVELEFEGKFFPAPGNWDALLSNLYGNYMTPPEENNRGGHFA